MSQPSSSASSSSASASSRSSSVRFVVESFVIVLLLMILFLAIRGGGGSNGNNASTRQQQAADLLLAGIADQTSSPPKPPASAAASDDDLKYAVSPRKLFKSSSPPPPSSKTKKARGASPATTPTGQPSRKKKETVSSPPTSTKAVDRCTGLWPSLDSNFTSPVFLRSIRSSSSSSAGKKRGQQPQEEQVFIQGSPVHSADSSSLPVPLRLNEQLEIRAMCEPYAVVSPPPSGTNASGCLSRGANTLVATRFFNVFDREKVEQVLGRSGGAENRLAVKECILREQMTMNDTLGVLSSGGKSGRQCIARVFTDLSMSWRKEQPAAVVVQKKPTVPFSERRRLLVVGIGKMPLEPSKKERRKARKSKSAATEANPAAAGNNGDPPQQQKILYRTKNATDYKVMMQTFLAVAHPKTDEMHIVLDYSLHEFKSFVATLRRREHHVRTKKRKQKQNSQPIETAADGIAAAKVVVWDVTEWRSLQVDPTESGTTTRVFYINHLLNEVMTDEHDGSLSQLLFSDARDVLFQTNPFDAVSELGLQPKSLWVGAEEQTHFCNSIVKHKLNTPPWERQYLGKDAFRRGILGRRLPDGALLPILNSGVFGANSFEAAKAFFFFFARFGEKCPAKFWGADQAYCNVAVLLAPLANFPYDINVLSPNVGPVRHCHYLDPKALTLFVGEQELGKGDSTYSYLNCAGRKFAILHQLDRRHSKYDTWVRHFNSRFDL